MSVGATEDQVVVLFKRFCAKVSSITCSYPLQIWFVYPFDLVAFVDTTSHEFLHHPAADRSTGSSIYSKIIFGL
jgi:hypothetical protein